MVDEGGGGAALPAGARFADNYGALRTEQTTRKAALPLGPSFAPVEPASAGRADRAAGAGVAQWLRRVAPSVIDFANPFSYGASKRPCSLFFVFCSVFRFGAFALLGPPLPSRRHARGRPYLGACLFAGLGIASEGVREGGGRARFIGADSPQRLRSVGLRSLAQWIFFPVLSCSFL